MDQNDHIVRCPLVPDHFEIPNVNLGTMAFDNLRKFPADEVAVVDCNSGAEMRRDELIDKAERFACYLAENDCRKGDVVAVFSQNTFEWILVAFGAIRADTVPAGINFLLTADELASQLTVCNPKFLYVDHSLINVAMTAVEKHSNKTIKLVITNGKHDGCVDLQSILSNPINLDLLKGVDQERSRLFDPFCIMFSSGTTGFQKAVVLSHQGVHLQFFSAIHRETVYLFDKPICFAPFSHGLGFLLFVCGLMNGKTIYFLSRFDFRIFLKTLSIEQVEGVLIVPPIATFLAKSPMVEEYSLSLKVLVISAAPLGKEVEQQLRDRFAGIQIRQLYGMTEVSGVSTLIPSHPLADKYGSVGVPLFNTMMKICDPISKKTLGTNQVGEICIKSPLVMIGYQGNMAATRDTIDNDDWLHSGDQGYYDEDGYFYVTDRIKELIKYNAYQVAPAELEAVLLSHPQVADAAVIGVPDVAVGELPMAFVVLKTDATISEKDLKQYVDGKVAPYKKLRGGVRYVQSIPKTGSGKIIRRELRAILVKEKLTEN